MVTILFVWRHMRFRSTGIHANKSCPVYNNSSKISVEYMMLNNCIQKHNFKHRYLWQFYQHRVRFTLGPSSFLFQSLPLCLSFPPCPPSLHSTVKAIEVKQLHCFLLIISGVMENRFLYKNQDATHTLKYSSLFTLQLRKFCNQFINLYHRYILWAIITSRDADHAELTIADIYQPIRIS